MSESKEEKEKKRKKLVKKKNTCIPFDRFDDKSVLGLFEISSELMCSVERHSLAETCNAISYSRQ